MDNSNNLKKARSSVLRYLSYRSRSKAEVTHYLERKKYDGNVIADIVAEMQSYGYIDDQKFTHDYILQQQAKGYGVRKVCYDLNLKNIEKSIIDNKINELFNQQDDYYRARELIEGRIRNCSEINQKWLQRQAAFLQRRGYENSTIYKVLKDYNPSE